MTREEALKIIEGTKKDYTQEQRVLRGLTILAKYEDHLDSCTTFEGDAIFVSNFERLVVKMTREEVEEMAKLGWFEDEEMESWKHY